MKITIRFHITPLVSQCKSQTFMFKNRVQKCVRKFCAWETNDMIKTDMFHMIYYEIIYIYISSFRELLSYILITYIFKQTFVKPDSVNIYIYNL